MIPANQNTGRKPATEGGRTNNYGPFDLSASFSGEGVTFHTLPWQSVVASQILVNVTDNLGNAILAQSQSNNFGYAIVNAEISFWGSISGYETMLKRQFVRSIYGPAKLETGFEDSYDNLVLKGRLFVYGKPGLPSDIVLAQPLVVEATVFTRPRGY